MAPPCGLDCDGRRAPVVDCCDDDATPVAEPDGAELGGTYGGREGPPPAAIRGGAPTGRGGYTGVVEMVSGGAAGPLPLALPEVADDELAAAPAAPLLLYLRLAGLLPLLSPVMVAALLSPALLVFLQSFLWSETKPWLFAPRLAWPMHPSVAGWCSCE